MLIINAILFLSTICFSANVATSSNAYVTSITSTKSKRRVVDSGYNNQEESKGSHTTARIPSLQGINSRSLPYYTSVAASATQTASNGNLNHGSGSHAYGSVPKRPISYIPTSTQQTESLRNSPLAPYFDILNNPNAYRVSTSDEKSLDTPKSIASPSIQKLQGIYSPSYNAFHQDKPIELSSFSDFEYPSFASINKLISQSFPSASSSPAVQVPLYKTSYPLSKVADYPHVYAQSFPIMSTVTSSSDKTTQSTKQKDEATVDVNGKKISVPIIQLQSNTDFSGVLPVFENQPFLVSANYAVDDLGFNFGATPKFNVALQSRKVSPFLSPLSSFQGHVVPIQTANSSPQFPQYKGAVVEAYPVPTAVPKAQGSYESLYSQPQLHFGKEHRGDVESGNIQQNTVHPSVSTDDILEDAEVINPKNPEPHRPQPDEDDRDDRDDRDQRYKQPDKEYESSEDDDDEQQSKKFKEPPTESDFKPSTSFPFKEYDERFGKYRAQSDEDSDDDNSNSRFKNYSSPSNDEEEENSSSDYRARYAELPKKLRDSYEEEDEEESRKHEERREETEEDSHEVEPKRSKYYGKDFEQKFEESYKKELPKQKYVHVKEVPEIDSHNNPVVRKRQQKNKNRSRGNDEQREESRSQESRTYRKNRKVPRTGYRDVAAYASDISVQTAPKVIYEEAFEYKNPETGKPYLKHAKTEKYVSPKKSPKEDSYFHAAKYYKHMSENKDPYLSSSNWKASKTLAEETVLRSNVRQLSDPRGGTSFYGPSAVSGHARSLTNAEILRDLTGI